VRVPLLDINAQVEPIRHEIMSAIEGVMNSCRFVMGPEVLELEERLADYVGSRHAIGVSSGTDALLVALMALDIGHGDIVLTSPYSFFATVGVISRLNARPIFIDINPDTYNIDPEAIAQWLKDNPQLVGQVKAIIPVHLYGQCAEMDKILAIADPLGIAVIEDAAQAIGATYPSISGTKSAGNMGAIGCFSFFPSKNLGAMGDGGLVTTNDQKLADKIRKLRNHGSEPKYYHSLIGGNFRLDTLQAAVLLVKLPHLESWHQGRRENAARYDELLADSPVKTPMIRWSRENHIYNQYIICVPEKRDELRAHLQQRDIVTEVYYPVPFHEQECFAYLGYKLGDFPKSEYAARHTLALPIYSEITREMQEYVAKVISEFYGK